MFPVTRALVLVAIAVLAGCSSVNGAPGLADAGEAGTMVADAAGKNASVTACGSPQECINFGVGPAVSCCIDKACIYGQSAVDAVPCTDADVQLIQASSYDQSCKADTDCIAVGEGDFCFAGAGNCPNAAINKSAYARYQADVAKTNAAVCQALSGCGLEFGPCCLSGTCHMGGSCPNNLIMPADAGATVQDGNADACAPSGCTGSCLAGRHNVSTMVGSCLVWQCCVPDDAGVGPDAGDASSE